MYRKLLQRLRNGCYKVKASVGGLQKSSQACNSCDVSAVKNKGSYHSVSEEVFQDASDESIRVQTVAQTCASGSGSTGRPCANEEQVICSNHDCRLNNVRDSWINLVNSHEYKNWLKVGLALRTACDFVSPLVEQVVNEMHIKLLKQHGDGPLYKDARSKEDSRRYSSWVKDVLSLHRRPPTVNNVKRLCDVSKWPTSQGSWEVAKVFMSHGFKTTGTGGASNFDAAALFNFLLCCRLVERYIDDLEKVRGVIQVRNKAMHCPRLELSDEELEEQFDKIIDLLLDPGLKRFAEKNSQSETTHLDTLLALKVTTFDVNATVLSTVNLLNTKVLTASSAEALAPSAQSNLLKVEQMKLHYLQNVMTKKNVQLSKEALFRSKSDDSLISNCTNITSSDLSCSKSCKEPDDDVIASDPSTKPTQESPMRINKIKSERLGLDKIRPGCKRKQEGNGEDSGASSANNTEYEPAKKVTKKSTGGGSSFLSYERSLQKFLQKQDGNSGAKFKVEVDDRNLWQCSANFRSNFAVIGASRGNDEDAEKEAALQALKWLGVDNCSVENAKSVFDSYCEVIEKSTPTYKTYKVSSPLYFTLLQVYNNHIICGIDSRKLLFKVTYESESCSEETIEMMAANTVLNEAGVDTMSLRDVKGALNEYALSRGGTLPIFECRPLVKDKGRRFRCTVTSLLRGKIKEFSTELTESKFSSSSSNENANEHALHLCHLLETTSAQPKRNYEASEECAAKAVLDKLHNDVISYSGATEKERLDEFAADWDYTPVFYTFQVKPLLVPQYECVLLAKCLHATKQEFFVNSDAIGFSNEAEARESASRNALDLLGQL